MARATLQEEGRAFFRKPSSLLLPFGVGVVATLLLRSDKQAAGDADERTALPVATLLSTISAFWAATRQLREEFGFDPLRYLVTEAGKSARTQPARGNSTRAE